MLFGFKFILYFVDLSNRSPPHNRQDVVFAVVVHCAAVFNDDPHDHILSDDVETPPCMFEFLDEVVHKFQFDFV